MRERITAVARVFLPAYASAIAWILAGIGWGVVAGATLEAVFGRGTEGLLNLAGGSALAAVAGALLGSTAMALGMTFLHGVTLIPLLAILGRRTRCKPSGQEGSGLLQQSSASAGAVCAVILGLFAGLTMGAMASTGLALESVYGHGGPTPALHWATALGTLTGGIVGYVELLLVLYRALPAHCRQQLWPGEC